MPQSEVLDDRIGIKDYQRVMRPIYIKKTNMILDTAEVISTNTSSANIYIEEALFYYNFQSTSRLVAFVLFILTNCMSPSLQVGIMMFTTIPACKRCLVRISYHLLCKRGSCFISAICIYLRILLYNIISISDDACVIKQ